MSIDLDAEGKVELRLLLGKRLRAARRAAKLTEMDAYRALNQKGATQISLWESGQRMPTIQSIMILAKLYAVPVDWLLGMHNDPIADPTESNQALIVNCVSQNMQKAFMTLCGAIAESTAVSVEGFNTDRRELKEMCVMAVDALTAVRRIIELNPEFEEDWRGSARLMQILTSMAAKGDEFGRRIDSERMKFEVIEKEVRLADMHEGAEQFMLTFAP